MERLLLNGEWEVTYNDLSNKEARWNRWIPAIVPGDVHLDLMREGLIPEPLVGLNTTKTGWIEDKEWWYKREFHIDKGFLKDRTELVCDGLDLTADIWLNGTKIGSGNNMHMQYRFDITSLIKEGGNEILVRLDVGFQAVKDVPVEKFVKAWGRQEPKRYWMRKAQQCFYWDTAPRLVTCGIWRDIQVETFESVILRDAFATSTFEEVDGRVRARIRVDAEIEALIDGQDIVLTAGILNEGTAVPQKNSVSLQPGMNCVTLFLELTDARLWWPNGMGEQFLYSLEIKAASADGTVLYGKKSFKHGIRSITVNQEPINDKEKHFTVVVNGCKVFCKGGNWVPSDAIFARISRNKEYRLLTYARDANCNMLRVWGGGVYPQDWFFDICDELGILVWQEFMYACGYYPDDEPEFCETARLEAETVVRRLRNHASLAMWCGNNENYMMHARVNPHGMFYGKKLFGEILSDVVVRLDPDRYYHPSSPYPGPWPGQEREGDQHVWSYVLGWHDLVKTNACDFTEEEMKTIMQIWNIPELNHKFLSEFGIFCPSNMSSVRKFMGEYPAVPAGSVYEHHRNHFEADFIKEMLRRYYKEREEYSLEEFILAGQMSQAECLKYIFETFRSRMYVCSGVLFWEFNDTWGHIGYSPVDYYLSVKPLYYYMKRAFEHLHAVFADNGRVLWLLNDTPQTHELELEYGLMTFEGRELMRKSVKAVIGGNSAREVDVLFGELDRLVDKKSVFAFVRVFEKGRLVDRNREFLVPIKDLSIPGDTMEYSAAKVDAVTWRLDITAKSFVWMVKIDDDNGVFEYSDNCFDLWPGESKTVYVTTDKEYSKPRITVENMNQYVNI